MIYSRLPLVMVLHTDSLRAQLLKNPPAVQETLVQSLGLGGSAGEGTGSPLQYSWGIFWGRDRLPTPAFLGFLGGSADKESACNAGDLDLIPGLGRSPGEGKGYPLQYSGLENSMDYTVQGVAKSWA